jgi:SAM-dependent methyltransferase
MDDVARYNRERWNALVRAGVEYSRPWLDLDAATARARVDPEGLMGEAAGRDVLCLAAGGGQQSAAFRLLGARVTVLDFSEEQLARDAEAARHYGIEVRRLQGDMRDLSPFADCSFDIVWQAHSINFIPDPLSVFDEVARVLRPGGRYRLEYTNPFLHGVWRTWDGAGYAITQRYQDGEYVDPDPCWKVWDTDGTVRLVEGPREFRHRLSTMVNGLVARGLSILGIYEDGSGGDPQAEPGSWGHFEAMMPPWITLWAEKA